MADTDLVYYAPTSKEENLWGRERQRSDEIIDKRLKILRAYKTKQELFKSRSEAKLADFKEKTEILPLSPIKVPKMKKFNWSVSPCIASSASKPPQIKKEDQWWTKKPSFAGQSMNKCQSNLSLLQNFTGSVKHNLRHHRQRARSRGVVFGDDYEKSMVGDFPEEAYKFLETSGTWRGDHMLKSQAQGDILTEATFRYSLRR